MRNNEEAFLIVSLKKCQYDTTLRIENKNKVFTALQRKKKEVIKIISSIFTGSSGKFLIWILQSGFRERGHQQLHEQHRLELTPRPPGKLPRPSPRHPRVLHNPKENNPPSHV